MKKLLVFLFVMAGLNVFAQEKIETTDQFTIEGAVKHPLTVTLQTLGTDNKVTVFDSVVIKNHLLQPRYTMKKLKGVLLKDLIDKAEVDASSPKVLSEYYVVCIASDNYKVVFSWNELYNTDIGNHVMVITESDGKPAKAGEDRIAVLSASDQATGRRFLKSLAKIIVERVK